MNIVHMMTSCSGKWYACYYGGKKLPIAAWALVEESRHQFTVGLVSGENDGALMPADNVPGFVRYKRLWF